MSLTHVMGIVGCGMVAFLKDAATQLVFDLLEGLIEVLIRLPFTPRTRGLLDRRDRGTPELPRRDRCEDGTPFRAKAR